MDVNVANYLRWNGQRYEPAWWWRDVFPFWLYFDEFFTTGALTLNAPTATTPPAIYKLPHWSTSKEGARSHGYTPVIPYDRFKNTQWPVMRQGDGSFGGVDPHDDIGNPMLINRLLYTTTSADRVPLTTMMSNFTVFITDFGDKVQFMNHPIHIRCFAGTSKLPGALFEPLFLPSRHALQATFQKFVLPDGTGTAAGTTRMYLGGKLFMPWSQNLDQYPQDRRIMVELINKLQMRRQACVPFWLTTEERMTLAAYQTAEFDCLVGDDGHFEGGYLTHVKSGEVELTIFNPDTKQTYMNGTVAGSNALGSSFFPQALPIPVVLEQGRRLRVRVTDLSGAANELWIAIVGRKIRAPLKEWAQVSKETTPAVAEVQK